MNRYVIIICGFLLGLNELRMLIDAHWIVINNTWVIVDFFMMVLFLLSGIINRKSFYQVALVFCIFIFTLASVGFYNIYFRHNCPLSIFAFIRPALLLAALYGLFKSLQESDTIITN